MHPNPPARYVPAAVIFCVGLLLTLLLCFIWQRYYYQTHAQAEFTPWAPPFFLTIGVILIVGVSLAALLSWYFLTSTSRGIRLRQAAQALGESEARLAAVIASAMDAVITVDSEHGRRGIPD